MTSQKQSQFTAIASIPAGKYLAPFGNGTNERITKENLFKQIKDETQIFIYPTIELLQAADLVADPDFPIYARVEETGYKLYKITSLAAGAGDIVMDNGTTASLQVENKVGTVPTFAALATTPATVGQIVTTLGYSAAGIGSRDYIAITEVHAATDNVTVINSATAGSRWRLKDMNVINVEDGGALGGGTDDTVAIQRCIDAFPGGKRILMLGTSYSVSSTIYLKYQGIQLVGAGVFATDFLWTAAGGTMLKANSGTTIVNGAGIFNMNISGTSTTNSPDVIIDMSGFSYGTFDNLETTTTRVNGVCWKFYSDLGTAPYFNNINNITMFGNPASRTQTGMLFTNGAWAGGSRGGNANCITNIKRAAGLATFIDLKEGQANMFTNISGESILTDYIKLNDIASYVQNGTTTSATANSLTDSTAPFILTPVTLYPELTNFSVLITGGAGIGQCRKITTHTTSVLTIDIPWGIKLDGTSTYAIARLGAFENMFTNVRQEGSAGTSIRVLPGAIGNKLTHASISGVTNTILDTSGHPSNHMGNGDLVLLHEVVENPGASANLNLWTKTSVLGGLGVGGNVSVEWISVNCPGIVSGTATITLDVDGVTVGSGDPSLVVVMDSVIVNNGFTASLNKVPFSSLNKGMFLNITTDASMNASTDFVITVALRIH